MSSEFLLENHNSPDHVRASHDLNSDASTSFLSSMYTQSPSSTHPHNHPRYPFASSDVEEDIIPLMHIGHGLSGSDTIEPPPSMPPPPPPSSSHHMIKNRNHSTDRLRVFSEGSDQSSSDQTENTGVNSRSNSPVDDMQLDSWPNSLNTSFRSHSSSRSNSGEDEELIKPRNADWFGNNSSRPKTNHVNGFGDASRDDKDTRYSNSSGRSNPSSAVNGLDSYLNDCFDCNGLDNPLANGLGNCFNDPRQGHFNLDDDTEESNEVGRNLTVADKANPKSFPSPTTNLFIETDASSLADPFVSPLIVQQTSKRPDTPTKGPLKEDTRNIQQVAKQETGQGSSPTPSSSSPSSWPFCHNSFGGVNAILYLSPHDPCIHNNYTPQEQQAASQQSSLPPSSTCFPNLTSPLPKPSTSSTTSIHHPPPPPPPTSQLQYPLPLDSPNGGGATCFFAGKPTGTSDIPTHAPPMSLMAGRPFIYVPYCDYYHPQPAYNNSIHNNKNNNNNISDNKSNNTNNIAGGLSSSEQTPNSNGYSCLNTAVVSPPQPSCEHRQSAEQCTTVHTPNVNLPINDRYTSSDMSTSSTSSSSSSSSASSSSNDQSTLRIRSYKQANQMTPPPLQVMLPQSKSPPPNQSDLDATTNRSSSLFSGPSKSTQILSEPGTAIREAHQEDAAQTTVVIDHQTPNFSSDLSKPQNEGSQNERNNGGHDEMPLDASAFNVENNTPMSKQRTVPQTNPMPSAQVNPNQHLLPSVQFLPQFMPQTHLMPQTQPMSQSKFMPQIQPVPQSQLMPQETRDFTQTEGTMQSQQIAHTQSMLHSSPMPHDNTQIPQIQPIPGVQEMRPELVTNQQSLDIHKKSTVTPFPVTMLGFPQQVMVPSHIQRPISPQAHYTFPCIGHPAAVTTAMAATPTTTQDNQSMRPFKILEPIVAHRSASSQETNSNTGSGSVVAPGTDASSDEGTFQPGDVIRVHEHSLSPDYRQDTTRQGNKEDKQSPSQKTSDDEGLCYNAYSLLCPSRIFNCGIQDHHVPDYKCFCLLSLLINPFLGLLALYTNALAKHYHRKRKFNYAQNLYLVTIVLGSIAIYSAITLLFVLTVFLRESPIKLPASFLSHEHESKCGYYLVRNSTVFQFHDLENDLLCKNMEYGYFKHMLKKFADSYPHFCIRDKSDEKYEGVNVTVDLETNSSSSATPNNDSTKTKNGNSSVEEKLLDQSPIETATNKPAKEPTKYADNTDSDKIVVPYNSSQIYANHTNTNGYDQSGKPKNTDTNKPDNSVDVETLSPPSESTTPDLEDGMITPTSDPMDLGISPEDDYTYGNIKSTDISKRNKLTEVRQDTTGIKPTTPVAGTTQAAKVVVGGNSGTTATTKTPTTTTAEPQVGRPRQTRSLDDDQNNNGGNAAVGGGDDVALDKLPAETKPEPLSPCQKMRKRRGCLLKRRVRSKPRTDEY